MSSCKSIFHNNCRCSCFWSTNSGIVEQQSRCVAPTRIATGFIAPHEARFDFQYAPSLRSRGFRVIRFFSCENSDNRAEPS